MRYALLLVSLAAFAQRPNTNYDEAKVPPYTLPEIGATSAKQWHDTRRAEIFAMFEKEMYGHAPGAPKLTHELLETDRAALGGKAIRKQIAVTYYGPRGKGVFELLLYVPANKKGKVPCFLGLNFGGNQSVNADPALRETTQWVRQKVGRGSAATRWEVERVIARGYATATAYYGDLDPDFDDGFKNGVHAVYGPPAADGWGSIGAWAWGLSRALDYLEHDPDIDARRVAVHGHSRLGKAALWAGAADPRFAMVISNDSGAGGAALSKRIFGETIVDLNKSFPHWFDANFKKYSNNEPALAFDQHMLLALIAPRPLYVASASEDLWADPKGEFLAALAADPVYRLLGTSGLPAKEMPGVDQPVQGTIAYHVRTGKHDITPYDWDQYLNFADKHLRK
jgi:hypothetical protein